jgi:hypothetical protein
VRERKKCEAQKNRKEIREVLEALKGDRYLHVKV